ncbi:AAA family ATPase [Clostridium baratii]|uniref:AAA family ATPase n=1 Tax=Clostridium baratii TaxID=1561 RepID=UPI000A4A1C4C|nr:AAA family ATPase [Clostridium baratii]
MIRSITLKDFKSHKESSYKLSEPILISVENGTGKSSIYEALTFSVLDYIP